MCSQTQLPLIVQLALRSRNVHCIILVDIIHTLNFSHNPFDSWAVTFTIRVKADDHGICG